MHGAKNVKGLHVLYPSIENSELAASDAPLKVNQTFTIPDPYKGSQGHFVVTSTINGTPQIVIDRTV